MVLGDSFLRQSTFVNKYNWVIAATLKKRTRFSRTDWLARAMDVLSRKGGARLRINDLCQELGVTKGSFYAHFEDRADFVRQFVAYWAVPPGIHKFGSLRPLLAEGGKIPITY